MNKLIKTGENLSVKLQELVNRNLLSKYDIEDFNLILHNINEIADSFKKSNSKIVNYEALITTLTREINYTKNDITRELLFACKEYIIENSEWYIQNEINRMKELIFYKEFYDKHFNFIHSYKMMRLDLYQYSLLTTMQMSNKFNTNFKTDLDNFELLFELQFPQL